MVVLISRKQNQAHKRLQEKLDHLLQHHHQKAEEDESGLAALQAFRTQVSVGLQGLIAGSNVGVSFSWVEEGLKLLNGLESGFMRLIEAMDCPMSKWGSALADEYLAYTLHLLDAFNSITSALAHLQSLRLSLAHALTSPSSAATRLLSFARRHQGRDWGGQEEGNREKNRGDSDDFQGNERLVWEAVLEMKAVALWVCRVVLSGLGGEVISKDSEVISRLSHGFPLLVDLDLREDYGELMEVKEVNEMVTELLAAALLLDQEDERKEMMQRKVETFQRRLEGAVEEVNCLFAQVLASRNKLMDCFRLQNQ